MNESIEIPIAHLRPSPEHLRRSAVDERDELEFAESVARNGILQAVLVRPVVGNDPRADGALYEIVAGHRRVEAARKAGLEKVPAIVREMDDDRALQAQVIENLQRANVHPMDEAEGYKRLIAQKGMSLPRAAERVARSPGYVYDRLGLLKLTPEAQKLFRAGAFTLAHAIELARLTPKDQARALDRDRGGMFDAERVLWDPEDRREPEHRKPRSVGELRAWIDEHVRFDAGKADPLLFPETALAVEHAPKVIPITHAHYVQPEARNPKERIFGPRSWKRADGKKGSKTCPHATLGFVAVGIHRGDAFEVCTAKDKCRVHWGAEMRERAARAKRRDGKPTPAVKGTTPEKPRTDPLLEKALEKARDAADERVLELVLSTAKEMEPKMFLRAAARAVGHQINDYLRHRKISRPKGGTEAWCAAAPDWALREAIAYALFSDWDGRAQDWGVDPDRIEKEEEAKARAARRAEENREKAPAKSRAHGGKRK